MNGFARTIQRTEELADPVARYVEMIVAAAEQMTELLEGVSLVARIEASRFDPQLAEANTLELALAAADQLDGAAAEGKGAMVATDVGAATRALAAFASCAQRHGPAGSVTLRAEGRDVVVGPVTAAAAPVIVGHELKDLGAAVALRSVSALGGSVQLADGELRVTLG